MSRERNDKLHEGEQISSSVVTDDANDMPLSCDIQATSLTSSESYTDTNPETDSISIKLLFGLRGPEQEASS